MLSPQDIKQHLLTIIFDDDPTVPQLLTVVAAFAFFWFIFFSIVKFTVRPLIHNKKWLLDAISKDYERGAKRQLKDLHIDMTKDEFIAFAVRDWPRMQSIYLQHFVGSFFCIQSILGIGDPSVASSLAVCGVLSEIGWELQDMIEIIWVRLFHKEGKKTLSRCSCDHLFSASQFGLDSWYPSHPFLSTPQNATLAMLRSAICCRIGSIYSRDYKVA
mmetsp:Transcript_28552/g.57470  ORF Transcript_28552/g.57470 Transcript_28552/m.57470 type:complete len:216 (+) Transcript_28552:128-775(+)